MAVFTLAFLKPFCCFSLMRSAPLNFYLFNEKTLFAIFLENIGGLKFTSTQDLQNNDFINILDMLNKDQIKKIHQN